MRSSTLNLIAATISLVGWGNFDKKALNGQMSWGMAYRSPLGSLSICDGVGNAIESRRRVQKKVIDVAYLMTREVLHIYHIF